MCDHCHQSNFANIIQIHRGGWSFGMGDMGSKSEWSVTVLHYLLTYVTCKIWIHDAFI